MGGRGVDGVAGGLALGMSAGADSNTGRGGEERANRLSAATSPYLLQHRYNPVDWQVWGREAFEEARRRDVPIFLSIGYSTCYWCHVMERESFESADIAAQMNRDFVCVKVDREERPDVDDLYMAAVQAFSGRGGWPMSVFLEPRGLRPFWAGTYYPAEPKFSGTPTFPQVLSGIAAAWRGQRAEVLEQAEGLAESVRERVAETRPAARIGESQVTAAVTHLLKMHDGVNGGFGPAPKFPQPAYLDLLLTVRAAAGDEQTRAAIDLALGRTLDRMACGGIFDQAGGGFHRYSVDARWLVPHFEKMLYDNGALAEVYARAHGAMSAVEKGGRALLARTARRICGYVLAEMTSPEGGFYSAQDAEVDHREGKNYLWTAEEIGAAVGPADAEWACDVYGVNEGPNFRDPHFPGEPASNVLFVRDGAGGESGARWGDSGFTERLDRINMALLAARARRKQPGRDDKIITGWNGLMIAGLAVAGAGLAEERFIRSATRAADFVLSRMATEDGGLLRTFAQGRGMIPAFLEDYAFFVHGLIELHRAGADPSGRYLREAERLTDAAETRFGDRATGGYFDALDGQEDLFVRARSVHDGATPSGQSVMVNNLIDLAMITRNRERARRAARTLAAVSGDVARSPLGTANSTRALLRMLALDRAALSDALSAAGATAYSEGGEDDEFTPVEVLSSVESVEVGAGDPGAVVLRVRIAEGYHVNAADPGGVGADLTPFRVRVVGGTGVAAYADYPPGEAGGEDGELRVYRGEFELPVVVERAGEWGGTPLLAVTYQACTETFCLRARTVELAVSIERR